MKRLLVLMAAILIAGGIAIPAFAAETGGQLDDCIHLTIGNLMAHPGEDIMVPVGISNVTGWGVMAFEMEICWCELPVGLLQYVECERGPVAEASGWGMGACGMCGPNCVSVAAAGATPLVGEGVLFWLKFHVSANAKPCMCCNIWFRQVSVYDPEDPLNVCTYDGQVCIEDCTILGFVTTWYCMEEPCDRTQYVPQRGVRVHLSRCGEAVSSTFTDINGMFFFECLEPLIDDQLTAIDCGYCLELDDCAQPRAEISAFDAALILRYLVCLETLTCCHFYPCEGKPGGVYPQQVAADVNCTGMITAYDASLILQYVVGLIPAFPCPTNWVWYWMLCFDGCVDYCPPYGFAWAIGVPKGDVSGYCYKEVPSLVATSEAKVLLGVPEHFDGFAKVPVIVQNAADVYSCQFNVDYNDDDFYVTDVSGAGMGAGFAMAFNPEEGNLFIAMASATPFNGSGTVAMITLQKKHTPLPVVSTRLEVASALLNETVPAIETPQYDGEVVRFALGPVSPNPFSEAAVINYSAARASNVSIEIYDVNGRLVQTVLSGQVEAGTHQAIWDGSDSAGSKVARGVYFCRMNAGEFSATEKVVLLQ